MSKLRKEMEELVKKYHQRVLSKKAFCAEHGISEAKMSYWVWVFNKDTASEKGTFLPIPMAPEQTSEIRILLPNGIEIQSASLSSEMLDKLMRYAGA